MPELHQIIGTAMIARTDGPIEIMMKY